jgi:hypothetical protein
MNSRDEIEAIKQLKYRYFRCVDQKKLDELEQLLLPECSALYHGGRYGAPDRAGIMVFLRATLGKRSLLTMHHGHHPEIEILSDTEATGIWYLHDVVIDQEEKTRLEGNGFYEDRYRKVDGEWKIAHTGYHRTFDIKQPLGEVLELFDGFAAGDF